MLNQEIVIRLTSRDLYSHAAALQEIVDQIQTGKMHGCDWKNGAAWSFKSSILGKFSKQE